MKPLFCSQNVVHLSGFGRWSPVHAGNLPRPLRERQAAVRLPHGHPNPSPQAGVRTPLFPTASNIRANRINVFSKEDHAVRLWLIPPPNPCGCTDPPARHPQVIRDDAWDFFLRGSGLKPDGSAHPAWLPQPVWMECRGLSHLEGFEGLCDNITANDAGWKKWYLVWTRPKPWMGSVGPALTWTEQPFCT